MFLRKLIEEPSVADSIQILQGLKEAYQDHHHVTITDEAIETAVKYAHRYLTSRQLPDSAIGSPLMKRQLLYKTAIPTVT